MSRISGSEARGLREAYANVHNNMNKKRSEELRESFFSWLEENKDIIPEGVSLDIKELYAVYLLDKGYISEQPVLSPRERSGVGVMRSRTAAPVVRPGQPVAAAPNAQPASGQAATTSSGAQPPQFSSSTINPPRMVAQPQSVEIARRVGSYTGTAGVGYGNPAQTANIKPVGTPLPTNAVKPVPGAPSQNATVSGTPAAVKPITPMDRWRAANTKLASAQAERERIRGTAQTDNPLMKDMRSRLPLTPSVQAPDFQKTMSTGKYGAQGFQSLTQNPNAAIAATPKPKPQQPTK